MENQAFIELVKTAIDKTIAQGQPSKLGSRCVYNGPEGRCCIVGHMMPDEETRKKADSNSRGTSITSLASSNSNVFEWTSQFTGGQISFLQDMQRIHDSARVAHSNERLDIIKNIEEWRIRFEEQLSEYIKYTV